LDQERENDSVSHDQFGSDYWPGAVFTGGDRETLSAVNAIPIKQSDGRHLQFGRRFRYLLWKRTAAKKTKGAASMQFDVAHTSFPSQ
jgi:hypothetical protein